MKYNKYAYRILLEFNKSVRGLSDELKDAFIVKGEEYEFIGGNLKNVQYPVENIMFPTPLTNNIDINVDNGTNDNTMVFNSGTIILSPLEVS